MAKQEHIITFEDVSFGYGHNKQILDEVSFPIRRGAKITLMGQNGAGKSTLFHLITESHEPESGRIIKVNGLTIAIARQTIPRTELDLTVREFFLRCFSKPVYDIDPRIDDVLVNP
jgi:ATPase subunit of ABC transporter with duplicated ATPase domains